MEIKNIIVSRTDKIGDLILSIPSFFMVKKMYPLAKLTVLVRNYNYDVVKNLEYIDEVIRVDDYSNEELKNKIRVIKAEVFIALFSDKFVTKLAKASEAKWKVGPFSKLSSFFTYNKGVWQKRSKSIKNEAEYNLDLIKSINPKLYEEKFELNTKLIFGNEHDEMVKKWIKEKGINNFVLVHPFSGGSAKNITDLQYVELLNLILKEKEDYSLIISSSLEDQKRAEFIKSEITNKRVFTFVNKGSLLNLAALIDKSDIFIGTSTGPTHVAGALGKKIIGIYPIKKTQSITRWGVYGNKNVDYILPEGNVEEDYGTKEFLSWGKKDIDKILGIIRSL